MSDKSNDYKFLSEDPKELAQELLTKWTKWGSYLGGSAYDSLFQRAYKAFYSQMVSRNHTIGSTGDQSEFSTIQINHLRNLINHIISQVTQNRLTFDAITDSTDISARNSALVANAVLDQYLYAHGMEAQLRNVLEIGLLFGTSFAYVEWALDKKLAGIDGEGNPVYHGEPRLKALTPYSVLAEPFKDDWSDQNWVVIREQYNKHDLAAMYPEMAEEILNLPKIQDLQNFMPFHEYDNHTVWLFKAYHKPTPSLPMGRYTVFCDNELVLVDKLENPYKDLPVVCYRPAIKHGGMYGHSPLFDLLPMQEALNTVDSALLTTADNFSIPNMVASKRSNIDATLLAGGLRLLEIDPDPDFPNAGMPTPMAMPEISQALVNYRQHLAEDMQTLAGISPISRGTTNSLTSGTAIAVATSAQQVYNSNIENGYIKMVETVSMQLINLCKNFMATEEILSITGQARMFMVTSFSGDTLSPVNRVRITLGNALAKSLAGRLEIANQLLGQGLIKPAQYIEVLQTGNVSNTFDDATQSQSLVLLENEDLARGEEVIMSILDDHQSHIQGHKQLLLRPDVRKSAEIVGLVMEHIQSHLDAMIKLSMENPMLLSLSANQPVQLPAPTAPGYGQTPPPGQGQPQLPPQGGQPAPEGEAPPLQADAESIESQAIKGQQQGEQAQAQANAEAGIQG